MGDDLIKFMVGGREVSLDRFADEMKADALRNIKAAVAERLRRIRCPEHGGSPQVTAKGDSLEKMEWEIHGCCQKLRDEAKRALDRT
jgi:hypothetical protein